MPRFANGAASAAFSYAMSWAAKTYGPGGKVIFEKAEGATDEDLALAKEQFNQALKRKNADGSTPESVKKLQEIIRGKHNVKVIVSPLDIGGRSMPDNVFDGSIPGKGTGTTITYNPNRSGNYSDGAPFNGETVLVHELMHSWYFMKGLDDISNAGIRKINFEKHASELENWHRKSMGIQQRSIYEMGYGRSEGLNSDISLQMH